ncbi:MAG: hypothetical protein HYT73_04585 [Candidatus Aenigmarchaeota archaeon]|nr:hypothetical protein [Candidatus Aenigmarchaeota archaeon]
MTNIMGFKIENDGPVYLCSDSQSTSEDDRGPIDKRPSQKLFYQDGVLFVSSGNRRRILELREAVRDEKKASVKDIMEKMLAKAKDTSVNRENPNELIRTFLAGTEDGHPVLYSLNPWGEKNREPYYEKIGFAVLGGAGQSQTGPAIERDIEMGGISLNDTAEGMALCFSYGQRAGRNIYVDDNFQIGIVGQDFSRTLYHPQVELGKGTSMADYYSYFVTNFDVETEMAIEAGKPVYEKIFRDAYASLNDLYQALLINCTHMNHLSTVINRCNVMSASDREGRSGYEESRRSAIEERDMYKEYASELINAWISGDARKIDAVLKSHAYRRFESYERAGMYFGKSEQLTLGLREPVQRSE